MSLNTLCIKFIQKYQKNKTTNGRCRHYPCCSDYGLACYKKFGFLKATFLTGYRIVRCNPLSKKVYDPVPLSKKEKKEKKDRQQDLLIIKDILLEQHQKYPLMTLQDDLTLIIENSLPNHVDQMDIQADCVDTEDIGFNKLRLYTNSIINSQFYTINTLTNLDIVLSKIEIWQNLVMKRVIPYPYSKKRLNEEIYSYITSEKKIYHSDIYIRNYRTNYYVVNKKDIF